LIWAIQFGLMYILTNSFQIGFDSVQSEVGMYWFSLK